MTTVKIPDGGGSTLTLLEVDGHYYPNSSADVIRGIRDVMIRDDDVLICAYPKSGTHWLWEITRLLLAGNTDGEIREKDELHLEFVANDVMEKFPSPRILNTHVLFHQLPRVVLEKKCKIISLARNPKDVSVSFYHHHKNLPMYYQYEGTWENYLPLFLEGKVDFGSWFTYMKNWEKEMKNHPELPFLTVLYEDLKEDSLSVIRKMAEFLGVERSEEFYEKVSERTSFSHMQATKGRLLKEHGGTSIVYRKGEVGDWKNHFTVDQSEMFDELYREEMDGSSFNFRYSINDSVP
ncbi:sulfotransferase 1C2-like [Haliotis cracherodii]|uniref:sulfotransferase 1C2-like n=1 Tax=Haliotis cracherodii TaxID=6455 RepID=UPI0039E860FF